jgi:hypothetical protein
VAGREIIYSTAFEAEVETLGGYRAIDEALDPVMDGLYRNPYGFQKFESDFISFRYAITVPTLELPALIVVFAIGVKGDVTLEHIEEYVDH